MIQDGTGQTDLTLNGAGTQIFTGSNTYSGLTTITAGTLQLGSGGATGSISSSGLVIDNGVLAFDLSGSTNFTSTVSGTGGVTQTGLSVLRLSSAGNNTYSGPTCISSGTLVGGNLPSSTSVQVAGSAVFDLAGVPQTVASLSNLNGSSGTVTSSVTGLTTLSLAATGGSTTFSGVIQNGHGTVALVMSGSGTQVLAGSDTYSGGTTVQGGVLSVSNDDNLAPPPAP